MELSNFSENDKWWRDPRVVHKEHMTESSDNDDTIQFISLGFLSLLLSDRYHNKLWVSHLSGAFTNWKYQLEFNLFTNRPIAQACMLS